MDSPPPSESPPLPFELTPTARRLKVKERRQGLRIIGVGGGKGGIGKSLLSASLGIDLARRGHRVVLDIGSGTNFNVLDFFLVADHGILTLVPEPTSIENGYRFLKSAFYRRLKAVEKLYGIQDLLESVGRQTGATQGPRALLTEVSKRDPTVGRLLELEMQRFRPRLVINMARTPADFEVGDAVVAAWRKFFGLEMDYLGCIGYDDEVWRWVRLKRPLLVQSPGGAMAAAVRGIADHLLQLDVAHSSPAL